MKREHYLSAWPQCATHSLQRARHIFSFYVDDRIKQNYRGERIFGLVQRTKIALLERDVGIQIPRNSDHLWGKIEPAPIDATIFQVARHLTWSTAQFTDA